MKRIASFFLALALAFSLTACTVPAEKTDDGKLQIVASDGSVSPEQPWNAAR